MKKDGDYIDGVRRNADLSLTRPRMGVGYAGRVKLETLRDCNDYYTPGTCTDTRICTERSDVPNTLMHPRSHTGKHYLRRKVRLGARTVTKNTSLPLQFAAVVARVFTLSLSPPATANVLGWSL